MSQSPTRSGDEWWSPRYSHLRVCRCRHDHRVDDGGGRLAGQRYHSIRHSHWRRRHPWTETRSLTVGSGLTHHHHLVHLPLTQGESIKGHRTRQRPLLVHLDQHITPDSDRYTNIQKASPPSDPTILVQTANTCLDARLSKRRSGRLVVSDSASRFES